MCVCSKRDIAFADKFEVAVARVLVLGQGSFDTSATTVIVNHTTLFFYGIFFIRVDESSPHRRHISSSTTHIDDDVWLDFRRFTIHIPTEPLQSIVIHLYINIEIGSDFLLFFSFYLIVSALISAHCFVIRNGMASLNGDRKSKA